MRLFEALDQASTGVVKRIAASHGIAAEEAFARDELAGRIQERLSSEYLRDWLSKIDAPSLSVLQAAADAGGEVRGLLVARLLSLSPGAAPTGLLDQGLLFRTFAPLGPHRGEVFAVPDEVLAILPPSSHPLAALLEVPEAEPPARGFRRSTDPAFSTFALASVLQRQGHARDHGAAGQEARLHAEVAGWSADPGGWAWQDRWTFLRHLLDAAGLLNRRFDEHPTPSAVLGELLNDRPRLRSRLWRTYLHTRAWLDLTRANVPHAAEIESQLDLPALRGAIAHTLQGLEVERWVNLEELIGAVERAAPTLLREQLDSRSGALRDPETGGLLLTEGTWRRVEGPLVRYVLLGPLYWLGCVTTDSSGERVALSQAGASLLAGRVDEGQRPTPEPISWQGLEIAAPARVALGTLLAAERYLLLVERGQISRYRLEQAQAGAAFDRGGSPDEARRLLSDLSHGALPAEVDARLSEWRSELGALILRPSVLMEARHEAELEELLGDREVESHLRSRLGPRAVEVAASEVPELVEALRKLGKLPKVDAALQISAGRRAYRSLVDEHVLEFLLLMLLAVQRANPEELSVLEGAPALLERLEEAFSGERVDHIREAATRLARTLQGSPAGGQAASHPLSRSAVRRRRHS